MNNIYWGDRVQMTMKGKEQIPYRHEYDTRGVCVGLDLDGKGRPIDIYVVKENRRTICRYSAHLWQKDHGGT